MAIPVLNMIVGVLLAMGGAQEVIVRGILQGDTPSLVVGATGTLVGLCLAVSGVALWRRWPQARALTFSACASVTVFCVLAALPPARYVGYAALIVGVAYPMAVSIRLLGRRAAA